MTMNVSMNLDDYNDRVNRDGYDCNIAGVIMLREIPDASNEDPIFSVKQYR